MGKNKHNKQKRKIDSDNKQESPVKKAKLADSPPEVPPKETKTDIKIEKTVEKPKTNESTAEKPKNDQTESTANFLKSKGPFREEVCSLLFQFKRLHQNNNPGKNTSDLTSTVESNLKKCDFSFKWNSTADKSQLYVEEFLVAEAATKQSACAKLVKLLEDKGALQLANWKKPKKPFIVRTLPPITQAKDADLVKILPKLAAYKSAFDNFKKEGLNLVQKVYACAKTSGIALKQMNLFDNVENCAKCTISLDGFVVCERSGKTKTVARDEAFDGLLGEMDGLVKRGEEMDVSSVEEPVSANGGDDGSRFKELLMHGADFVLFELPGCDAERSLNYSAEMNNSSLVFKVFKGVEAFSLGANFIAAVESDVNEPLTSVARVAVERLKRRCYTVVVKKTVPDIKIERNEILIESAVNFVRVEEILREFSNSYNMHSVVFSSDFSESETQTISKMANKLHLEVNPTPVFIMKKKLQIEKLLGFLLDNGGSVDGFELISPQNPIL